ncbi:MAG: hypothetical protein J6T88_01935 [Bacteroidales bacterium]|nr:hypothetical protein [Bacteroidales bacterium]
MEENRTINQEAMRLLDEAAFTSSKVKKRERKDGVVSEENMYPASKAETDRMTELLHQAEQVADDVNEEEFRNKYDQLNDIVQWSNQRHRTWSWGLIVGALVCALILLIARNSDKKDAELRKANLAQVEAWTPCDTTITWENSAEKSNYDICRTNANNWKAYRLSEYKSRCIGNQKSIENYQKMADTASTQEKKESYLKQKAHYEEESVKNRARFDSVAAMKYEQVKQDALNYHQDRVDSANSSAGSKVGFIIFLLVLIALYIWTGYPYGYELTRTRTRDKILGWVRKISFWLAGVFFGTGLLMQLFAPDNLVEYVYSNGRRETRREADIAGTTTNVMIKFIFMAIGLFIFCFISILLMLIETIGGLRSTIATTFSKKKSEPTQINTPAETN